MDDVRWFAPNRYCGLPVPALRERGLRIAESGDGPARIAFAADGQRAVEGFAFARRHNCPLVLYVWDLPPWRLGNGRADPVFATGGKLWKAPRLVGGYPERAGYYSRIRYVARHATEVWSPSTRTVADVQRHFGVEARRIPFCYDSDRFNAAVSTPVPTTSPPVLLSISRLTAPKNHSILLRAAAQMNRPVEVRIIGRGEEARALRSEAASLCVTLRLDEGWASDEEIVAAYQQAAVVVCPSLFEGFGLTPMEGLAMGRPVIASNIPVHREFVDGEVRFFDPADAAALARACEAALDETRIAVRTDSPLSALTIDSCAARIAGRLEQLLSS